MKYKEIKQNGKSAKGKMYLLKYLDGETLTSRGAVLAKCYECTGMYMDGKVDCKIKDCPLYPYMPYREGGRTVLRKMSDEQKEKAARNLRQQ
jgi:hypothetical protein